MVRRMGDRMTRSLEAHDVGEAPPDPPLAMRLGHIWGKGGPKAIS
jgi:hypothetical protein